MLEQVGIKWPESPKKAWQRRSRRDAHRDHRVVKDETMVTVVQDNSGIRTTRHRRFQTGLRDIQAAASVHKPTVTFDRRKPSAPAASSA